MTCTEACRKAMPGTCCCSCSGAHHGEAAPVQQKLLTFVVASDLIPGGEYTLAELGSAVNEVAARAERVTDEMLRERIEGSGTGTPVGIRAFSEAIKPHVEVHAETCACEACRSEDARCCEKCPPGRQVCDDCAEWSAALSEANAPEPVVISDALLGASSVSVGAVFLPEDCKVPAGFTPSEAVQAGLIREPHNRTVQGRTVHLSPGYRYTLDCDEGEPIWIASCDGRRGSAVDPDAAARKALGA